MRKLQPARKLAFGLAVTASTVLGLAVAAAADSDPAFTKLSVTRTTPTRTPATPPTAPGTVLGLPCGEDEVLVEFDVPIYDPVHGWWVIGWETTWFCVPEDLEPAG
jgi:hypothetical protein